MADQDKMVKRLRSTIMITTLIALGACLYFKMSKSKVEEELGLAQKELKDREEIFEAQKGNVYNLRDDISVLQDSLRLIRSGQIVIYSDSSSVE